MRNELKKLLIILLCLGLAGCVTLPGTITERVSDFDKTKEIVMEPAWVLGKGWDIKLGLYKTSKMDWDKAILVVVVEGAYNFAQKESVQFNIDGEKKSLESIDFLTNIETIYDPPQNESSKRYSVKKDFIKRLLDAKEVWVRVNLSKNYVEGKFSADFLQSARPAFRKFYKKAWETNQMGVKK